MTFKLIFTLKKANLKILDFQQLLIYLEITYLILKLKSN